MKMICDLANGISRTACAAVAVFLWISGAATAGATWGISQRIPLGSSVVRVLADPNRNWVYAIDRQDSEVLFINLPQGAVHKRLYVGKDPTDFDLDATGSVLYVANKGDGTGIPGSWRIGVVALTNQTLLTSYITPVEAVNVTAGRAGRLYYNAGYDIWNGGDAHALNTDEGTDLGSFAAVKTRMAIASDKSRLFGQYIYEGNLGAMGVFDIAGDSIKLVDSLRLDPTSYGWDYDNYCLSADDQHLTYGQMLFNPANLKDPSGRFEEQIYALNHDGAIAVGQTSMWSTVTLPVSGVATKVGDMPFHTTVMAFDRWTNVLYACNTEERSLYVIEPGTSHGIPLRWLLQHGLDTQDSVEAADTDNDGLSTLQEWLLDSDPTQSTPAFKLEWSSDLKLTVPQTSPARWYELERSAGMATGTWQPVLLLRGTGGDLGLDVSANAGQLPQAFYRVRPRVQ